MNKDQIRRILIKFNVTNQKALRNFKRDIAGMNKSLKTTSSALGGLSTAFAGFISFSTVRVLTQFSDELQLLRDRIKVFTGDMESAEYAFDQLAGAARFTKTSIASLAETYNRIALATTDIGLNTEEVIALTTALQQTFRLSGATIAETTATIIQLTQGLSSGQLRGQELRSVIEQNAVVARLLTEAIGITRGQLIKFAETGKITSDVVIRSLSNSFRQLNEDAGQLGQTFEQSFVIITDTLKLAVKSFNEFTGASEIFAGIANAIADGGPVVSAAIGALSAAIIGSLVPAVLTLTASFIGLKGLIGLGFGAVIGAAAGLITYYWKDIVYGLEIGWLTIKKAFIKGAVFIEEKSESIRKTLFTLLNALDRLFGREGKEFKASDNLSKLEDALDEVNDEIDITKLNYQELKKQEKKTFNIDDSVNAMEKLGNKVKGTSVNVKKYSAINAKFLEDFNRTNYAIALQAAELNSLKDQFRNGAIDLDTFTMKYVQLTKASQSLTEALSDSSTFRSGVNQYLDSVKSASDDIVSAISRSFNHLEDELLSFIKTGKFSFTNFAQAILDDINKIIIRWTIVQPIADGLKSALGIKGSDPLGLKGLFGKPAAASGSTGATVAPISYSPPTPGLAPINGGAAPLRAGAPTTVNVVNNSGANATVSETNGPNGRTLEVLIDNHVKNSISSGKMDRVMSQTYGLSRRGY